MFLVRREVKEVDRMAEGAELKSENWVMVVSEQHRYQGVSYKSDIIVISGNPLRFRLLIPTDSRESGNPTRQKGSTIDHGFVIATDFGASSC